MSKIVKGIGKGFKKLAKGVGKVFKKLVKSKIFWVVVAVVVVYFTWGAGAAPAAGLETAAVSAETAIATESAVITAEVGNAAGIIEGTAGVQGGFAADAALAGVEIGAGVGEGAAVLEAGQVAGAAGAAAQAGPTVAAAANLAPVVNPVVNPGILSKLLTGIGENPMAAAMMMQGAGSVLGSQAQSAEEEKMRDERETDRLRTERNMDQSDLAPNYTVSRDMLSPSGQAAETTQVSPGVPLAGAGGISANENKRLQDRATAGDRQPRASRLNDRMERGVV
jgi:hypothetical protein